VADFGESLKKELTLEEFERFRDWIHRHSGIYLEESKADSLRISLVTRATRFGFVEYDEYFKMLTSDEAEFKELMNLVTINETSFFRFPAQFEALRTTVIPEILESKPKISKSFRVWSAGCSTGEEPYTIAMTLLDSGLESMGYRCEVFGTDVSTQALDRAKNAVYPARSTANLPEPVSQRWFEPVKGGHRPVPKIRDIVDLSYHNLIKEPYPLLLLSNWDVIFCRNVTIYFRLESTRRVVNNFFDSLNPGGYLFIGHSETLTSISDRFEPVEVGGVFLYRKPRPRRMFSFDDVLASRPRDAAAARRRPVDLRRATPGEPATSRERRPLRQDAAAGVAEAAGAETAGAEAGGPEAVDKLVAHAHALLDQGMPDQARAEADKALDINENSIEALLVRAFAAADSGDFDAAIADAHRALTINPLVAPARYVLGIIFQRQGDLVHAINEFKRTIYIDRDFVLAHFNLANIHKSRGAMDDACREYENSLKALYQCPDGPWTAFLGGFSADLLAQTCERSLIECRKGT